MTSDTMVIASGPGTRKKPADAIRVLVVDDQSFMRILLRQILEDEEDIQVVGEARNGTEAVAMAHALRPDAITLDVEMPEMDGLEACTRIMQEVVPKPAIIMVSAYTQDGADAAVRALRLGAVDFVSKSSTFARTDLAHIDTELRLKLRAWVKRRPAAETIDVAPAVPDRAKTWRADLVVIAVSTGGPQALTNLLAALGPIHPPIVIAQHMPEHFTASLARSLTIDTHRDVWEGSHRLPLLANSITLIPGAKDAVVAPLRSGVFELRLVKIEASVHPSADALFESAALVASAPVGVVLTGMGQDGTRGSIALRRRGAPVLVQDPGSCIVGGMPQSAFAAAPGCEVLTIKQIANRLALWSRPADSKSDVP